LPVLVPWQANYTSKSFADLMTLFTLLWSELPGVKWFSSRLFRGIKALGKWHVSAHHTFLLIICIKWSPLLSNLPIV
jgi:hypothetical protein